MLRTYGSRIDKVIGGAKSVSGLGRSYGAGLYQADLDYLQKYEYARKADDVLYRRTKRTAHDQNRNRKDQGRIWECLT